MPSVADLAAAAETPLASALAAGVDNISYQQTITFDRYVRMVLPLDGFVYWVKAGLVTVAGSVYNQTVYNVGPGQPVSGGPDQITAKGSLHFTSVKSQVEDNSATVNSVIFTSETGVDDLDATGPNEMYVGTFMGAQFAFGQRYKFYRQSGLYHYRGDAINAQFRSQLISAPSQITNAKLVVSNSMPIWIGMTQLAPVYPSFAVPMNLPPPYVTAHIDPSQTTALQAFPAIDSTGSHWQLVHDTVRFTLYGLDNGQALAFQDSIISRAMDDACPYGVMNMPVMHDEKMTQSEFQVLAQKKTFTLEVSYYQANVAALTRQLILSATVKVSTT